MEPERRAMVAAAACWQGFKNVINRRLILFKR
jgi:hypothetical protein